MAVPLQSDLAGSRGAGRSTPRRIAVIRAAFALAWAAALVIAVGGDMPSTHADLPIGVAALLASYPLIDVVASLVGSTFADTRLLRVNAAISTVAVAAIGVAAFGSDAGATLVAFGAWAAVSGVLQLGLAVHRRRSQGRQLPMMVSGGLSTIAGVSFLAASGMDEAHLANVAGYMALGAVLFLLWAGRFQVAPRASA
jgi:uncharacterized membrane protein HdeD (DUF308 family)